MTGRLAGRTALITGGATGIGLATATLFCANGAHVVISARDAVRGEAAVVRLRDAGGAASFIPLDVRDEAACARAIEAVFAQQGRLDVLFNNAGIVPYRRLTETPTDVWLDTFATNVHGIFYLCRAAIPRMIAQGGGVIVNNASDWAVTGGQNAAAYSASKGAVAQMTRSMALDYAREGIRVNAICPGDTYVERWRGKHPGLNDADPASLLARLGEPFPLGRVGHVDEIARAVLFLASDDSSYMTGQMLIVDGGNTAGGASTRYAQAGGADADAVS